MPFWETADKLPNTSAKAGDDVDMLRIIAAAIAFVVCTFEGYSKKRELKERTVFLSEISLLLERFAVGIRCDRMSDELLERENCYFANVVKQFAKESDARTAWEKACDALPKKRGETAVLRELGRSFGTSDKEGTLRLLECCETEIATLKTASEKEYAKCGKAFFRMWTLCGIGAAVLIV